MENSVSRSQVGIQEDSVLDHTQRRLVAELSQSQGNLMLMQESGGTVDAKTATTSKVVVA